MGPASITLSFDDAPVGDTAVFDGATRTRKLIETLREAGISQAAFYCNTNRPGLERLASYAEAGHLLANHTSSHPDLEKVAVEDFQKAVLEAESTLEPFKNSRKWFRYPYLREAAKDREKNQRVKDFLLGRGYRMGFVTIETYDWSLDSLLQKSTRDGHRPSAESLSELYCRMLLETIDAGVAAAQSILDRQPVHVLLLHENDLNALFLADFVRAARDRGFVFPDAEDAFLDPIADREWECEPRTMRRLETIAKKTGRPIPPPNSWLDEKKLGEEFKKLSDTGESAN